MVEDGTLKGLGGKGGDILTTATFDDFEFAWEWRLSFQGNSGVKYFVDESRGNATGAIGHEYQMIDDENYDVEPLSAKQKTGGWYDVMPAAGGGRQARRRVEPVADRRARQERRALAERHAGRWRTMTDSPESQAGIANSKFKDVAGFADKIPTPILLQDHDTVVWFRNLKIRKLPGN